MTQEQRLKDNCRSYAGVYKRRGKLIQEPCKCGNPDSQMHHDDYYHPLRVQWKCRQCHLKHHTHTQDIVQSDNQTQAITKEPIDNDT